MNHLMDSYLQRPIPASVPYSHPINLVRANQESQIVAANEIIGRKRLQDLVDSIDPNEKLDPDVEQILLEMANEFIDNVATNAAALAKHRGSNSISVKDVQLHLDKYWDIRVPGFSSNEVKQAHPGLS
eukprot:TRINITY_DN5133_c0_g1_i6.p1 TRINITY_DN5133_c0_g1~~TRINITY_DN5133_c0_g1_i6.p1  ORF type:complete len:146 (-),score=14.20 TRINITY_DN5133_c0_g1_i6:52-435(-)